MSRGTPKPLPRLLKTIRGAAALCAVGALGLGIANYIDYRQVQKVYGLKDQVSQQEWEDVARYCRGVKGFSNPEGSGGTIPSVFTPIAPLYVSCDESTSDLKLYERGEAYAYVRVSSSLHAQRIYIFHNLNGAQEHIPLWSAIGPSQAELNPPDRVFTLREWTLHGGVEFIGTENALLFVERGAGLGLDDHLIERVSLDSAGATQLRQTIEVLRSKIAGKAYVAQDVCDGVQLVLSYSKNGDESDTDTILSNAWSPEMGELMAFLKSKLNPRFRIPDATVMMNPEFKNHIVVQTTKVARFEPKPKLPWWVFWR